MKETRTRRRLIAATATGITLFSVAAWAHAQSGLSLKVITSSPGSLNTNFTLIQGESQAVLVDVPFLRSDAYRLVADILDSGKTLTTIIVTHAHPDHYFTLDVLRDAFPNARAIAAPVVVADVWSGFPNR
jgi:glyoxylase-like metal-dependent hydrolase (beta-lactamase superfamily II)